MTQPSENEHAPRESSLSAYLLAQRGAWTLGTVLVIGQCLIGVSLPFIIRWIVDDLSSGQLNTSSLARYAGLYLAAALASGVLALCMRRVILGMSRQIEYQIRRDVFAHLTSMDQAYFRRERTGDLMTRMGSDLSSVRELLGQGLLQGTRTISVFVLSFCVMFAINWQMASALFVLLPAISVTVFLLLRRIRRRYERTQEQFSTMTSFCQESFAGIRPIKSFAAERRKRDEFHGLNEEFIRRNLVLGRLERLAWALMAFLFLFGVVLLLMIGGRLVIRETLTLGQFVQFMQYLVTLQWPMLALGWTGNLIQRGLTSWKRIAKIIEQDPSVADGPWTRKDLTAVNGDIAFHQVSLCADGRALLQDLDFTIPQGSTIALTGPTGSGKSLLVSLIARLQDPSLGQVVIGGHETKAYPLEVLRNDIGMAPQEPFLFSDTVARNIGFGLQNEDHEKVMWAAEIANLRQEVEAFPSGFDTLVGERGVTLSGGQRQRTAIGRAIAKHPRILILDDVLSAVDTQNEAEIMAKLAPVFEERTTILVSHRVSTLRHAETIMVLEDGRITQTGSHDNLVNQPGYYRHLDEVQRLEARLEDA